MPNLNPDPSDQIDISGNIFTLGATLPGTPTMGSVLYTITGINPGISYYFSVVSFSDISGYSGWAGPIVVYIEPEVRTAINAYSWTWPHTPLFINVAGVDRDVLTPVAQYSNTGGNLFYLSNRTDISSTWQRVNFNSSNSEVTKFTGITPPFEGANVTAINIKSSGYYNLRQTIYNLIEGVTYTYSFYHNIEGVTGLAFRIDHPSGLTTPIRQIEPIDQGNFSWTEENAENTLRNLTYPTGTGWRRFVAQFVTKPGQTSGGFSIFSKFFPDAGSVGTAYIAAPQLSIGTSATPFISTSVVANWEGLCGDDDKWLAFGNSYGLTFISPTIDPVAELSPSVSSQPLIYAEGFQYNNSIARTAKLLKSLPANKRALLPSYFFSDDTWYHYNDSLGFTSGQGYTFFDGYYDTIYSETRYPSIWSFDGVSYGKALWDSILYSLSNTGATVDYLINNSEMYGAYGSFNWDNPGLTTAMISGDKSSLYFQEYRGLTSWNDWLNSLGATINRVMIPNQVSLGNSFGTFDFAVWDAINRAHELAALNAIFENTESVYPNITKAEYEWSYITDGGPNDGPPSINGHADYWQYYFGNAAAPQLYGWMSQITTVYGICGANPTYLYFAPDGNLLPGDTRPQKNAWTSFLMGLQAVRSSKRSSPTLPITPWIASVKFKGQNGAYPGNTAERPHIGFADMNLGYNPQQGITLTVAGGNSAYYYEMIKHSMLTGVKSFLYWNTESFNDARVSTSSAATSEYLLKFANGQGATGFIDDMQKLNDCIADVNTKIGGFTLSTADASRISWLAPYVASGAPGPNGITWWWRITTNPGNTTFVNGQTLSVANNNTVGTWVTTTGPTLAGITITYA